MPRIARSDVNAVLQKTAQRIIDAGGADGRTSRAEMQVALKGLSGAERALADVFFRFVDHRDFKKGAQVTPGDVKRAVEYAKSKMIARYDLNGNGLSKDEIARMSLTGKLAVDVARALKEAAPSGGATAAAFAKQLTTLTKDISFDWYGSEADDTWKSFTARHDGGTLTAAAFSKAMKLPSGPEGEVSELSVQEYFDAQTGKGQEPAELSSKEQAAHEALFKAMKANLKDLRIFMVGADDVVEGKVYIVGRAKDGNLAGIEATRIYT